MEATDRYAISEYFYGEGRSDGGGLKGSEGAGSISEGEGSSAGDEVVLPSGGGSTLASGQPSSPVRVVGGDRREALAIAIRAPTPAIHREMMALLGTRQHDAVRTRFAETHVELQPEVMRAFMKLAWVQEYCRHARIARLTVRDATGVCADTLFDLDRFVYHPKSCCRVPRACSRIGIISCSKCLVTVWCSEECLAASYSGHQEFCEFAFQMRVELEL